MEELLRHILEMIKRFRREEQRIGEYSEYTDKKLEELEKQCAPVTESPRTSLNDTAAESENEREERRKRKKKQQQDMMIASIVKQLIEIKEEGLQSPLPCEQKAAKMADEILRSPEMLKAMEIEEMRAAVEQVEAQKLESEDKLSEKIGKEAERGIAVKEDMPRGSDEKSFFKQALSDLTDYAAEMLAVKTMSRTIKSYITADGDLSKDEIQAMTTEMFSEKSITACSRDIKSRDDFKRMMSGVKSWDDLKAIKQEIVEGGSKLFDRLAKTSKKMIRKDTERRASEQIQAETEALQRQQGRVLKPANDPFGE